MVELNAFLGFRSRREGIYSFHDGGKSTGLSDTAVKGDILWRPYTFHEVEIDKMSSRS